MTTKSDTALNDLIVQNDRIEDGRIIVEKLSNGVWSHIQHWASLSCKENLSRTQFLNRYKDAEERYLTFQRLFLHHLVVSSWKLDAIRGKLETVATSYDFDDFIANQVHTDEVEFCRPATGLSALNHDMDGMFDRLIKSSLLYVAQFNHPSSYTISNYLEFPLVPLRPQYLSDMTGGIKKKEAEVIKNFTDACLNGFEGVVSDSEWELLHMVGCFSSRDSYNVDQEVKMFKTKFKKPLFALLKQTHIQHPAKKDLLNMFKIIGDLPTRRNDVKGTEGLSKEIEPYLEFKALIEASVTYQDVNRIFKYKPKTPTIELSHIVSRLLRVANWYVSRGTAQELEMSPEETNYLKNLALDEDTN